MVSVVAARPRDVLLFPPSSANLLPPPKTWAGARPFVPADLYLAFMPILVYALFYLFVLDRAGVHLYPIFSPRSPFSFLSYCALFAIYAAAYVGWGRVQARLAGETVA